MLIRSAVFACMLLTAPAHVAQGITFVAKWGTPGSGPGQFQLPRAVAVDNTGNVYVVDVNNARVQKFTNDGVWLGMWGTFGTQDGQFDGPVGIAIDRAGFVYVLDSNN